MLSPATNRHVSIVLLSSMVTLPAVLPPQLLAKALPMLRQAAEIRMASCFLRVLNAIVIVLDGLLIYEVASRPVVRRTRTSLRCMAFPLAGTVPGSMETGVSITKRCRTELSKPERYLRQMLVLVLRLPDDAS